MADAIVPTCGQCSASFAPNRPNQRFCSPVCKTTWTNRNRVLKPNVVYRCEVCDKQVERYVAPSALGRNALRFCSRKCKGTGLAGLPQKVADRPAPGRQSRPVADPLAEAPAAGEVIVRRVRERKPKVEKPRVIPCGHCGKEFHRANVGRLYCSKECLWRHTAGNRDRVKQATYNRGYRAEHRQKYREIDRERYRRNPEKWFEARDRYRARKANAPVNDFTEAEWKEILERYGRRCVYCGAGGKLTKDHVIPLSKGGAHTASNIVPACKSCNSRKCDRPVEVFKRD